MVTYQQLKTDPVSRDLFDRGIKTPDALCAHAQDSAFLAIDTEHVPLSDAADRFFHQVGLAYLPTLEPYDAPKPYLAKFVSDNQVQTLLLDVEPSKEELDRLLASGRRPRSRRSHRFGANQQIHPRNLQSCIIDFITTHHTDPRKKLVLMGFSLGPDWEFLIKGIPEALSLFSAWVDVRDIAENIAPVGQIPNLKSLFTICGYHWKNLRPCNPRLYGSEDGHNAVNDVVATCAVASALLMPQVQQNLLFRQQCAYIAGVFKNKPKPTQRPSCYTRRPEEIFTIKIRVHGLPQVPRALNSEMKVARLFFSYSPKSVGIDQHAVYVTFNSQDAMDKFFTDMNGSVLLTGETLELQMLPQNLFREKAKQRREMRELRGENKPDFSDVPDDFGSLFS